MKPVLLLSNHSNPVSASGLWTNWSGGNLIPELPWNPCTALCSPRPSIPTVSHTGKASPALLSMTSKDRLSFHPPKQLFGAVGEATETLNPWKNPSWDVPAGTTTSPAHSSTPEPVPALEIKDVFPSIESEALASLEYHNVFHSPCTSTGWGGAHREKLEQGWHWDEGMQKKS